MKGLYKRTSRLSMITTGIPRWMSVAANELLCRVCTDLRDDRILQCTAWWGTELWVLKHTEKIQCSLSTSWYSGWCCCWSESSNLINKLSCWLQLNPVNPLHAVMPLLISAWVSAERILAQQVRGCWHIHEFNCNWIDCFIYLSVMHGAHKLWRQNGVSLARWTAVFVR